MSPCTLLSLPYLLLLQTNAFHNSCHHLVAAVSRTLTGTLG